MIISKMLQLWKATMKMVFYKIIVLPACFLFMDKSGVVNIVQSFGNQVAECDETVMQICAVDMYALDFIRLDCGLSVSSFQCHS